MDFAGKIPPKPIDGVIEGATSGERAVAEADGRADGFGDRFMFAEPATDLALSELQQGEGLTLGMPPLGATDPSAKPFGAGKPVIKAARLPAELPTPGPVGIVLQPGNGSPREG